MLEQQRTPLHRHQDRVVLRATGQTDAATRPGLILIILLFDAAFLPLAKTDFTLQW